MARTGCSSAPCGVVRKGPIWTAAPELREGLIALGHEIKSVADSYMDYGAGQMIVATDGGYAAGSDSRRDGQAAGF